MLFVAVSFFVIRSFFFRLFFLLTFFFGCRLKYECTGLQRDWQTKSWKSISRLQMSAASSFKHSPFYVKRLPRFDQQVASSTRESMQNDIFITLFISPCCKPVLIASLRFILAATVEKLPTLTRMSRRYVLYKRTRSKWHQHAATSNR